MAETDKTNKNETPMGAVFKQTAAIALISLAIVAAAHPLFIVIGNNTELFDYVPLRFILGSVYGWILGVANFFAMALSLVMLTSSSTDRMEGQKRAQSAYMGRLVALLLFAVGGCFIPIFHPAAILISLALTQFGIFAYSLIFKLSEAKKQAKTEKNPQSSSGEGEAPDESLPAPDEQNSGNAQADDGEK